MMWHYFIGKLNTHDKFMWYSTENVVWEVADSNIIKLQEVKSKI